MKKLSFLIRFLTLLSYFSPFVFYMSTCVGSDYRTAYNKKEAFENEAEANRIKINQFCAEALKLKNIPDKNNALLKIDSFKKHIIVDLTSAFIKDNKPMRLNDTSANENKTSVIELLAFPTNYSLSALGCIFEYKNLYGSIFIGASLFFSLASLFLWRFFVKKKIAVPILILNFISISVLLIDSFISKVDLLWGFWLLFVLLLIQLLSQLNERKKEPA